MLKYLVMRRLVIAAVAFSVGCHDAPALDIDVTHPAGLAIAQTAVTVYESPTLTCDDVEFGRLDDTQLTALTTAEETIESGGATTGTLDGISRTASKIIVAQDYDATGALLAAGCTALGAVSSDTTVPITTIVAATVAILPPAAGSAAIVTAFDPNGAPIDGRAISWTVYGPAGSTPATTTGVTVTADGEWSPAAPTCTSQGTADVHVVPPSTVGGYAVQLQVAWATSAPPLFSDLTSAQIVPQAAGDPTSCAIRHHGGAQSLICLTTGSLNDTATNYTVTGNNGVATIAQMGSAQTIAKSTFALVSLPDGSDLDVYSLDDTGAFTNLFDAPTSSLTTPCSPSTPCDDAIVVPACGSNEPTRILIHETGVGDAVISTDGTTAPTFSVAGLAPKFGTAGCVAQLTGSGSTLVQAATFTSYFASGTAALDETYLVACDALACKSYDLERGDVGVGFIGGTEPRIVIESIDATGVVLVEAVLSDQTSGVIERASLPSASIPEHIVSGQFDTDGNPDLLWDIAAGVQSTSFEVAYAKLAGTQPLEALSPAVPATVSQILVGDLTGDGIDDLAILATGSGSGSAGVAVVPMGASTPVTVMTDMTCEPN